jgi:hypothetical protein
MVLKKIYVVEERGNWQAFVNAVMNPQVPKIVEICLSS